MRVPNHIPTQPALVIRIFQRALQVKREEENTKNTKLTLAAKTDSLKHHKDQSAS